MLGTKKFLDENEAVKQPIINALSEAQKYAADNSEDIYELLGTSNEIYTAEVYKKNYEFDETFEAWKPLISEETIDIWQRTVEYMKENKYIDKK